MNIYYFNGGKNVLCVIIQLFLIMIHTSEVTKYPRVAHLLKMLELLLLRFLKNMHHIR